MDLGPPELVILLAFLVAPVVVIVLIVRAASSRGGGPVPGAQIGPPAAAPGWYADPLGPGRKRYFDGQCWTDHLSD